MDKPRCYEHRERETLPILCHTCQRIAVEHDIVVRVVDAFLAAGYGLKERDDEYWTSNREQILATLFDQDDAFLVVQWQEGNGWVHFVFGNDGFDVISDYTLNLDDVLAPINAYADTLAL